MSRNHSVAVLSVFHFRYNDRNDCEKVHTAKNNQSSYMETLLQRPVVECKLRHQLTLGATHQELHICVVQHMTAPKKLDKWKTALWSIQNAPEVISFPISIPDVAAQLSEKNSREHVPVRGLNALKNILWLLLHFVI